METKSPIFLILLAGVLLMLMFGCKKEEPKIIPTITVLSVTNITANSANSGGEITSDGGATITARGVCWNTTQNPTTAENKTNDGSGTGSFTSSITGISPGVTYYVRAYAVNEVGTAYSTQSTFNSKALLPVLTTASMSDITSTSAGSGGNITSDGGAAITARGVCWATSSLPTISNSKTIDGTGTGGFTSNLSQLTANTTYYIRAYATNSTGTAYGNELIVTTLGNLSTPAYKTTLKYNSNGNTTEEIKYQWDLNTKSWINFSKITYSYDIQWHKTQSINSTWDTSTQSWINDTKDTFSFFAFEKMWQGVHYKWNIATNQWTESNKYDNYSSDIRNSLLYVTYYTWSNYSWKESKEYRYDFTFNNKGKIYQETHIAYSAELYGYYGSKSKGIFTYDPKGNIIGSEWTSWDSTYGWSSSGLSTEFKYDINKNPIQKTISKWDSTVSAYVAYSKIIYTYNSSGNLIEYIEYSN